MQDPNEPSSGVSRPAHASAQRACLRVARAPRFTRLMLLAIDIGNSNVTFGVFAGAELLRTFRAESRRERTGDECGALLAQLVSLYELRGPWDGVVIESVVPALTPIWERAARLVCGCDALVVHAGLDLGLDIHVERPEQVGVDRLVNVAAARARWLPESGARDAIPTLERGSIVVDLGTATTFDCVSPRGEFLGGIIAPGISSSLHGLIARAAQLRAVELAAPAQALGKNTTECLQAGLIFGHAALIDGLLERLMGELPFECDVLGTGGLAPVVAPHTRLLGSVDPELTLRGLRWIYARNMDARAGARR